MSHGKHAIDKTGRQKLIKLLICKKTMLLDQSSPTKNEENQSNNQNK